MSVRVKNVRPWGGVAQDLCIDDNGLFTDSVTDESKVIDGGGLLALPGLVNTHAHVDKSWWGKPWQSYGGEPTTDGRIAHERARRDELGIPGLDVTLATLTQLLRHGTTAFRSHVDVDLGIGLRGIEVVREAVAQLAPDMRYEIVAFPQDGVLRRPGVDKLLRQAAEEGAQHIGGLDPAGIDRDPVGQLNVLFDIADATGCGIDIHLHDPAELGAFQMELIIERARTLGLTSKVNIAHGFFMGQISEQRREPILEAMHELDISMTTVAPLGRDPLPMKQLRAHGIRVGFGTDGFRDLWGPYGTGDLLITAQTGARMTGMRLDEDLAFSVRQATSAGLSFVGEPDMVLDHDDAQLSAQLSRYRDHDFTAGRQADLILVDAENPMDALVRFPRRELVLIAGREVRV